MRFAPRVIRAVECKNHGRKRDTETAGLIASLPPEEATPEHLPERNRGHWGIESRVHCIRDKVFEEDRCHVRTGVLRRVLAAPSGLAIEIFLPMGVRDISRFTKQTHLRPNEAAALVCVAGHLSPQAHEPPAPSRRVPLRRGRPRRKGDADRSESPLASCHRVMLSGRLRHASRWRT